MVGKDASKGTRFDAAGTVSKSARFRAGNACNCRNAAALLSFCNVKKRFSTVHRRMDVYKDEVAIRSIKTCDFRRHLEASLKDPAFKEEWDAQAVEREVARGIVEARMREGLTQQELARRSGMKPANLCRLENGNGNPSVATLSKIASGLGRKLEIRFV